MSWSFLPGLVAAFSEASCSDTDASAQLSTTPMPDQFYWPDKPTEHSRISRFGMTCEPLTGDRGEELLTWFRAGFRAKRTAAHLEGALWRTISGRKCGGSWQMSLPGTYLPRTLADAQLSGPLMTLRQWVTTSDAQKCQRQTWVLTTYGHDVGYLHTPTTMANFCADSMQKHPSCRMWRTVFGEVTPEACEWLMGWPIGHTALKPSGTGKCRNVEQQHGDCLQEVDA